MNKSRNKLQYSYLNTMYTFILAAILGQRATNWRLAPNRSHFIAAHRLLAGVKARLAHPSRNATSRNWQNHFQIVEAVLQYILFNVHSLKLRFVVQTRSSNTFWN